MSNTVYEKCLLSEGRKGIRYLERRMNSKINDSKKGPYCGAAIELELASHRFVVLIRNNVALISCSLKGLKVRMASRHDNLRELFD